MRRLTTLVAFAFVTIAAPFAAAQDSTARPQTFGRIAGRVIDSTTGLGIVYAGIQVVGAGIGTNSGVDGRYRLEKVPTGPLTLQIRRIGMAPLNITGLYLNENQALEYNITMAPAPQVLAPVVTVSAAAGSASAVVDAQRVSTGMVNATSAEQIAKSPDGNAAQAAQRISGINIGENGTVTARGLIDKYTISSLNGARIPSPEPEKRVVPLDLFPSGLLQSITTSKTFTPDLPGDFAGALVDIKTKEFPAHRMWSAQLGSGYAAGATGTRLIAPRTVGGEAFANASSKRALPELIRYVGNFEGLNLSQADQNMLIGEFRNAWTPTSASALPLSSGSVSFGGNDPIFGQRIGYLFSGTFSSSTEFRDGVVRALAGRATTPGQAVEVDRFEGQIASQGMLWGGIMNASTMIGTTSRLSVNAMYNRTADNDVRVERGSFEVEAIPVQITRMQYVERAVRSLQLAGEHQTMRHRFDWAATNSGVRRDEPDRSSFIQVIEQDTPGGPETLRWLSNNGAIRTFSALSERSNEGRTNYQLTFGPERRAHSLKVGGLLRSTTRDADTREYSVYSTRATPEVRSLSGEQLFDGRFTKPTDSVFQIAPLSQGGSYNASDRLAAAYAMAELAVSERIRIIAGARFERDKMEVDAKSTLGTPVTIVKQWDDVLPSLTANIQLSETQQLRLAVSRTMARPEYRELVPIASREVLNGDVVVGNDRLERTRILNADVRWEWYGGADEILSVAVFAKRFDEPIERVYRAASSGRSVFYTNADQADNYGVEVEWRRQLGTLAQALEPFTVFSNVTLMKSSISLRPDAEASATNLTRHMVGQAPYVFNAGLTYSTVGGATATLLYNRVGERIDAAGESPLPDVIEGARGSLDLSLRFPIVGAWSGRFDAKNLLDAPFRTTQGSVTREEYRLGRVLQAGIVWRP